MHPDAPLPVPADRHYHREHHLWAHLDGETGRARVGVDALGLESLGELAFVALVEVGTEVTPGGALGSLEAAKMTSVVSAPVGGTVVARNEAALADPIRVNADPYGDGWLVELEPSDWARDAAGLVSGGDVAAWAAGERARLEAEAPADR